MTHDKVVFVLWADRFDETLAALFVAEFRKAGLRVKLVSLAGHPSPGAYGVTLVPDLTLEQALPLARHASCVVIPCGASGLKKLKNDPRLQEFLADAREADALLIVNESGVIDLENFDWKTQSMSQVIMNADGQQLVDAMQRATGALLLRAMRCS